MCGRFTVAVSMEEMDAFLKDTYAIEQVPEPMKLPRYNVAPGQDILAVIHDGQQYRAGHLKWGFIPHFAKNETSGYPLINARAETLEQKPAFAPALKHQRCVILADGFYEWKRESGKKIPMRFLVKDMPIFPMAGLWSTYIKADGTKLHSCTIITTQANALVADVHERMPVILSEDLQDIWLNPFIKDWDKLSSVLQTYPDDYMAVYQVSSIVNKVSFDTPECIQPESN